MKLNPLSWARSLSLAVLIVGAAASAQPVPNEGRCASDQIGSNYYANERIEWALKCGHINAQQAFNYRQFFDIATGTVQVKSLYTYPLYGWPVDLYNTLVWIAPMDRNAPCTVGYNATYGSYARVVSECLVGCYTPEQKVRFATGDIGIQEAMMSQRTDVVTLAPGATFDRLTFQTGKVVAYVSDVADAEQPLLNIRTRGGGHLRVTTNHPIVDSAGVVKQADEFQEGEELIRADGSLDAIVSIEKEMYFGKTYNLKPATFDPTTNIVVAQGFLNGSSRFQDKTVTEGNRVLLRQNIPDSALAP
ncbi:hypothetical protein LY474_09685 [Myxococcus stipitatus]|uniref:hypothetical protein n=1 Tax=Myxococcus stipitatus TaxID=83455 RepID=UPI001F4296DB|nr:hypothetical protein [Myxococcus stipitatus]MCE9668083.1 hypothetical protein [Myxococcus stipitatus]